MAINETLNHIICFSNWKLRPSA